MVASVDLRRLRYFVAVCEERNLGRAAARLHMTQPPLTRAMASLEHDLGARLLDRSASGVSPTPAGMVLYDEARVLLGQADHLRESVARAPEPRAITVGVLADVVDHLNAALLPHFRQTHPSVAIRIYEADLTDPSAGLRSREADVALTRSPLDGPGIRTLALGAEPVGVVVRCDDPIAGMPLIRVETLTDRDWVCLPQPAGPAWHAYWSGAEPRQPPPAGQLAPSRSAHSRSCGTGPPPSRPSASRSLPASASFR